MAEVSLDSALLNHKGLRINVPGWVKRELRILRQLEYNREHRLWQIKETFLGLLPLLESPTFKPLPYRAQNFESSGARSSDSGRANRLLQALGSDLSGLNTPARDEMRRLQADIDHTRLPGRDPLAAAEAERIVAEVKAARRRNTK